ncbi:nitrite reductase small subunit NirD [Ignavibacteria bacterium 4148-Me]|uniref:nitrite reductase small subunit NirD n=1 Tax=Rosettibacter primus TaxID=3111523 RepID=UPI00336C082A
MIDIIEKKIWLYTCTVNDVPENGGVCIKYEDKQIAVFNFTSRGEWYAVQNLCPHKNQLALSRGIIGDKNGEPKVACPFHKKNFSLISGYNLDGEDYRIDTFPVKIEKGRVYIGIDEE